jgi:hypothetical protein
MSSKASPFYRNYWFLSGIAVVSFIFFSPLSLVLIPLMWSGPVFLFGKESKEMTDKQKLQLTWIIVVAVIGLILLAGLRHYR